MTIKHSTPVVDYEPQSTPKRMSKRLRLFVVVFILIFIGCCAFYYYTTTKRENERKEFESVIRSNDIKTMQAFLDKNIDAPQEYRDTIMTLLAELNEAAKEWHETLAAQSSPAFQRYLAKYPKSIYKTEALRLIDSIDWVSAYNAKTPEALKSYIEGHPNGSYLDKAEEIIRQINTSIVRQEEHEMINLLFTTFFQSINSKNETRLLTTVNNMLYTFLGKHNATKTDVVSFMNKLWKEDIIKLSWYAKEDYKISKKEVGYGKYEFSVQFSALEIQEKESGTAINHYRIKARINPDEKITEFSMSKIIEEEKQ